MKKAFIFVGAVFIMGQTPAIPQEKAEIYISRIVAADQRIFASKTKWQKTQTIQPEKALNIEKIVAQGEDSARQSGADEEYIKQIGRANRESAERALAGSQQVSILSLLFEKDTIWCEKASSKSTNIGGVAEKPVSYHIDFYNGKDMISLDRAILEPQQTEKDAFWLGKLTRDNSGIMRHVGKDNLPFLVGIPSFSEILQRYVITKDVGESITFEMTNETPEPRKSRITFSKLNWRPISEELINGNNRKLMRRNSFSEYTSYPNGIWFPKQVLKESFYGDGDVSSTEKYLLLSASFNDAVDVSQLKKPLPVGSVINDFRFAPRSGARYKIRKGGIPGDETVLDLVEKREANTAADRQHQQLSTARNFALPLGAAFMVSGLFWFRRSRRATA